jgi:hypothetical protein
MIADTMSKIYRMFTGKGRPGEKIQGALVQHYGFRSWPPAGTDFITLQQGNFNISVAENEGVVTGGQLNSVYLQNEGDVLLYRKPSNGIPGSFIALWQRSAVARDQAITIDSLGDIFIRAEEGNISISTIGDGSIRLVVNPGKHVVIEEDTGAPIQTVYPLATGNHSHQIVCPSGGGTVVSGPAIQNPATPGLPPLTQNLQAT